MVKSVEGIYRNGKVELLESLAEVAMSTSNMARAGHASRVVVRVDSESARGSGLLMDLVIMTDNLATIQYSATVAVSLPPAKSPRNPRKFSHATGDGFAYDGTE